MVGATTQTLPVTALVPSSRPEADSVGEAGDAVGSCRPEAASAEPICRTPQPRPIPSGVLGEPLAAGTAEPTGRAVEDSDRPGRLDGAHALERRSGRQIGEAVVVEVAGRQREAEEVERLGLAGYARGVLGEQLAAGAVESGSRAIADNDRPGCLAGRGIIGLAGRRRAASRRGRAAGSICWERVLR